MANIIKWTGNTARFANQKTGKLLSAELQIVKNIKEELRQHVGGELPRGSAIKCVYEGENGIPFVELRNYGSAALSRLQNSIGQVFQIDVPASEVEPTKLNFTGEVV